MAASDRQALELNHQVTNPVNLRRNRREGDSGRGYKCLSVCKQVINHRAQHYFLASFYNVARDWWNTEPAIVKLKTGFIKPRFLSLLAVQRAKICLIYLTVLEMQEDFSESICGWKNELSFLLKEKPKKKRSYEETKYMAHERDTEHFSSCWWQESQTTHLDWKSLPHVKRL